MKLRKFVKENNFHDCRANNFIFNKKDNELTFTLFTNQVSGFETSKCYIIKFYNVIDIKCKKELTDLDDFILNIWSVKGQANMIEIIFDDDECTTIYVTATNVEIL